MFDLIYSLSLKSSESHASGSPMETPSVFSTSWSQSDGSRYTSFPYTRRFDVVISTNCRFSAGSAIWWLRTRSFASSMSLRILAVFLPLSAHSWRSCSRFSSSIARRCRRSANASLSIKRSMSASVSRSIRPCRLALRSCSDFIRTKRAFLKPQAPNSVSDFQELIYKVRNNMFHSGKPWIQEEEAKLLEILNPVVKDTLSQITENYENDLRTRRVI